MYYWYSMLSNRWYVMDKHNCIHAYHSVATISMEYPDAELVPCVETIDTFGRGR
jgi:hypothetical protein